MKLLFRRLSLSALLLVLLVSTVSAHAEDFRVIGTITKQDTDTIIVRTKDGKLISIRMDRFTKITRDNKQAVATDLKVGRSVVADAVGESLEDLLIARQIRIVPTIKTAK